MMRGSPGGIVEKVALPRKVYLADVCYSLIFTMLFPRLALRKGISTAIPSAALHKIYTPPRRKTPTQSPSRQVISQKQNAFRELAIRLHHAMVSVEVLMLWTIFVKLFTPWVSA